MNSVGMKNYNIPSRSMWSCSPTLTPKRTASTFHINMKILCVVNIGCCMPFSLKEFILNGVKGERNYITLVRKTQTMVYARTSDLPELDERVSECILFALLRRGFSACSGV